MKLPIPIRVHGAAARCAPLEFHSSAGKDISGDAQPRTNRTSQRPAWIVLAACMLLAACSITRESPVKQTYLIEPALPSPVAKTQPVSVRVSAVNVAAPYRGRNFVVRTGDLAYVTDFYDEYLVPPSAMLAEQTARALQNAKSFALVLPPAANADADYVLEGFVSMLYGDNRAGNRPAAEVTVQYYLTSSSGSVPMWTHEYHRRIEATAATAQAYSEAVNTAVSEILAELVRDLAALDLKKPS